MVSLSLLRDAASSTVYCRRHWGNTKLGRGSPVERQTHGLEAAAAYNAASLVTGRRLSGTFFS